MDNAGLGTSHEALGGPTVGRLDSQKERCFLQGNEPLYIKKGGIVKTSLCKSRTGSVYDELLAAT